MAWPSDASADRGRERGRDKRRHSKVDDTLQSRAGKLGTSRVIVTFKPGSDGSNDARRMGARFGRRLSSINGHVVELPNWLIARLADHPAVERIDHDRPTTGLMSRVGITVGAREAQLRWGYTGAGVGVAVVDSGIANWHDDLGYAGSNQAVRTRNNQRVVAFADFVNGEPEPYDDNGHGTHVAGIIAGNGHDTYGAREGIAPAAHLVGLKVLDRHGRGVISDVIAALDWAVANRVAYNIRVINLSVGAAVTGSYEDDPLALAAKRAVDAGIVVVTAAGNVGEDRYGRPIYGGILAPGNAPWVLTVGASNHMGTVARNDDRVADFSSRGPTAVDYEAKPDLVAPGTGIVSLANAGSYFYATKATYLINGLRQTATKPYLTLSGTSMAAPVVAGSVALMLEANPSLSPNLVKAILQYTAQRQRGVDALTQGAGFLNTKGAVELARYFQRARPGDRYPSDRNWSGAIHWGNRRLEDGVLSPHANAWDLGVVWGSIRDREGDNIVWGTVCGHRCDEAIWGTIREGDNIVWGTIRGEGDNIVWGTIRGEGDNIVWGTASRVFNIVWGTLCGGDDCFNIVWGTARRDAEGDNIVWGTLFGEGDNIVWGTVSGLLGGASDLLNVVWGTAGEFIAGAWGTALDEGDNIVWGTSGVDGEIYDDAPVGAVDFDALFESPPPPPPSTTTTSGSGGGLLGGLLGGGL
jgi:serine protease AprX